MSNLVGGVPGTVLGMLADLCHKLQKGAHTERELKLFLKRQNPFGTEGRGGIIFSLWQKVYEALGFTFPESLWIDPEPGFWDLYLAPGLTPNKVVDVMSKLGITVETYGVDLDRVVQGREDRDPSKGPYRIRFRANVEADEKYKKISANQLEEKNVQGITLTERLLLGLIYFLVTEGEEDLNQRHLDVENITLCSGSRYSDGYVPCVYWHPVHREVCVYWDYPSVGYGFLRARLAVSL